MGSVTLQNVSTYDFFVYLHDFIARDPQAGGVCTRTVDRNITIDFAHIIQDQCFQSGTDATYSLSKKSFKELWTMIHLASLTGSGKKMTGSPFAEEHYGIPSNSYSLDGINVTGRVFGNNSDDWNTICDISYWNTNLECSAYWRPCNPTNDRAEGRPLQRGKGSTYLLDKNEVMIASNCSPSLRCSGCKWKVLQRWPSHKFSKQTGRLEHHLLSCPVYKSTGYISWSHAQQHSWLGRGTNGWRSCCCKWSNIQSSSLQCGPDSGKLDEMWKDIITVPGQNHSTLAPLPAYVPVSGAHPGHNSGDYVVPFFPIYNNSWTAVPCCRRVGIYIR